MKTCNDYKQEMLECIDYIRKSGYSRRYNFADDYEKESAWYEYKDNGYSCYMVTINSKLYSITPWSGEDIDFILDSINNITYVNKDEKEDTVVGNIDEFIETVNSDLLTCDYTRYVETCNGCFTKQNILDYLNGM